MDTRIPPILDPFKVSVFLANALDYLEKLRLGIPSPNDEEYKKELSYLVENASSLNWVPSLAGAEGYHRHQQTKTDFQRFLSSDLTAIEPLYKTFEDWFNATMEQDFD